jgi:hypothetical protein
LCDGEHGDKLGQGRRPDTMKLDLRLIDKPYEYRRRTKSVLCREYRIESMSPMLHALDLEVRNLIRKRGKSKIRNLDIRDASAIFHDWKRRIAAVDHGSEDEQKELVVAILPEVINEWIYAHELLHILHPEVKRSKLPHVEQANAPQNFDLATLNAILLQLFRAIIDHFINRFVYDKGFDINDLIEVNIQALELPTGDESEGIGLMSNYLMTFSMGKYVSEKDRLAPDFEKSRENFSKKYPLPTQSLDEIIRNMDQIPAYDFETIKGFVSQTLVELRILEPIHNFAKYAITM